MTRLTAMIAAFLFCLPQLSSAETELLMAEEHGCVWCEKWDEEIAHIYPKTQEGKAAPLRRYDLQGSTPEGVTFKRAVIFTPTFILVRGGQEVDRIEGYPGDEFFWWLLATMLERAGVSMEGTG